MYIRKKIKPMKKINVVLASMLTISALFTSCSTHNFNKRKYTKGMYFESIVHTMKPQTQKIENNKIISKTLTSDNTNHPTQTSLSTKSNHQITTAHQNIPPTKTITKNQLLHSNKIKQLYNYPSSLNATNHTKTHSYINATHQKKSQNTTSISSQKSSDDKIIQVILALFPILCLIAIYLHDGKKATTNFWVGLILHLLFLLPAIIFALLVVLDIINLA